MKGRKSFLKFLVISLVFGFILPFNLEFAEGFIERNFFDDFNNIFFIDLGQTSAKIEGGRVVIDSDSNFSQIVSSIVINTSEPIIEAFFSVSDFKPEKTNIIYYLSNNNGQNWVQVRSGSKINFSTSGGGLRWKGVLTREKKNINTPFIESISIKIRADSKLLMDSRDLQRIIDLDRVITALDKFFQDWGKIPDVDAELPEFRWAQLRQSLNRKGFDGRFYISDFPQDPLNSFHDFKWTYDYINFSDDEFILSARLENSKNKALLNDIDGRTDKIDCNDPIYCIGNVGPILANLLKKEQVNIIKTAQAQEVRVIRRTLQPTDEVSILVDSVLTDLYRPIIGKKALPRVSDELEFEERRFVPIERISAVDSRLIEKRTVTQPKRFLFEKVFSGEPRLVKEKETGKIYEIINGQRHWIPNMTIFNDYGFDPKRIEIISRNELLIYPRAKLFKIQGDRENRIYYLTEGGYIRLIPNQEIFFSYGNRIDDIIEISRTEFDSYPKNRYITIDKLDPTANDELVKNKIWQVEGDLKRLVTKKAFSRLNITENEIGIVNRTELDYYKELEALSY